MTFSLDHLLSEELAAQLSQISHVALDMDGTIYHGETLLSCTLPFLEQLDDLGIRHTFVTNNPSKGLDDYVAKLRRMGIPVEADEIYTSALATIDFLRRDFPKVRRIFALGTPSMLAEFEAAGFELTDDDANDVPDAVVIGFDLTLTYSRLCRSAWWIRQGKIYIATNPDWVCPTELPTVLVDCGSICALLEKATGRSPDKVLGKPDPAMIGGIIERYELRNDQIVMVGDRIYTDILMAHRANILSVLVLTGECTEQDAATAGPAPHIVVPSLAEFGLLLEKSRKM
ncbi:MAG: HAD-IIA family hydrolase [Pirellulaceae bacterium]|nr:HAD-IIA family hydrolase [Pirellulaceae bacterium]